MADRVLTGEILASGEVADTTDPLELESREEAEEEAQTAVRTIEADSEARFSEHCLLPRRTKWFDEECKLTKRDVFRRLVAQGVSPAMAARKAGYKNPDASASQLMHNRAFIDGNREYFAQAGVTENLVGQVVFKAMHATRTVSVEVIDNTEGGDKRPRKERITEEDPYAQMKAVEIYAKMTGAVPEIHQKMHLEVGGKVVHEHNHTGAVVVASVTPEMLGEGLTPEQRRALYRQRMRQIQSGQAAADEGKK